MPSISSDDCRSAKADYRQRIYAEYATVIQDAELTFDLAGAKAWGKAFDYFLRRWLPESRNAAILDVACGDGKLLSFFQRRGYTNLSGVDISPQQVGIARQVIPSVQEADVLEFLQAQSQGRYDLITGLDIIEHLRKDEVFVLLDGCHNALRDGGRIVLQTPNACSPWGAQLRYADFTHELGLDPNSITRLLRLCGYTDIEVRETGPVPWGYSFASSLRWICWQAVRGMLKLYNLAETGSVGSGVFTRVMLVSATKK